MRLHFFVLASVIATALLTSSAFAQDEDIETPLQPATLGDLPDIHLAPSPPPNDDKINRIKKLIDDLVEIDSPDYGLSPTLSGSKFAPLPGQERSEGWTLADHGLKTSAALKELVELGPDALPFLVKALDDQRPTKLKIEHKSIFGMMKHSREFPTNAANPFESNLAKRIRDNEAIEERELLERENLDEYTVKVGDVCFVIIGQITGRTYNAVRYQWTACVMLNCPAHDRKLRDYVKAIWKEDESRSKLFEFLRYEYAMRAAPDSTNEYHCAAAMRLLYYFHKESAELLAKRIERFESKKENTPNKSLADEVSPHDFIKAVAWSKEPAIQDALMKYFTTSTNAYAFVACLPAIADSEVVRGRCETLLAQHETEPGPWDFDGYCLLTALIERSPKTARDAVLKYLKDRDPTRCRTVCRLVQSNEVNWDIDVVAPLLKDKREARDDGPFGDADDDTPPTIRICDDAAQTLASNHPEYDFDIEEDEAIRDRRIAEILRKIGLK